jgi:hypothetical protein
MVEELCVIGARSSVFWCVFRREFEAQKVYDVDGGGGRDHKTIWLQFAARAQHGLILWPDRSLVRDQRKFTQKSVKKILGLISRTFSSGSKSGFFGDYFGKWLRHIQSYTTGVLWALIESTC